jgi:5-methylcytosine-specific restriction endonuclease McrA
MEKFKDRGCCRKPCKLFKDGECKDGHNPVQRGSTIYTCGYQKLPSKEKTETPLKKTKLRSISKKAEKLWAEVRKECKKRDGSKCVLCDNKNNHCHHFQFTRARRPGLKYEIDNLAMLCESHHNEAHKEDNKYFDKIRDIILLKTNIKRLK